MTLVFKTRDGYNHNNLTHNLTLNKNVYLCLYNTDKQTFISVVCKVYNMYIIVFHSNLMQNNRGRYAKSHQNIVNFCYIFNFKQRFHVIFNFKLAALSLKLRLNCCLTLNNVYEWGENCLRNKLNPKSLNILSLENKTRESFK